LAIFAQAENVKAPEAVMVQRVFFLVVDFVVVVFVFFVVLTITAFASKVVLSTHYCFPFSLSFSLSSTHNEHLPESIPHISFTSSKCLAEYNFKCELNASHKN